METNNMRPCPFCGEEIRAAAKKCHYCGEWLNSTPPKKPSAPQRPQYIPPSAAPEPDDYDAAEPFYQRFRKIFIVACCAAVLAVAGFFGWAYFDAIYSSSESEPEVEYFAAYDKETDSWCLINAEGKVLVKDLDPTMPPASAINGRFTINQGPEYELYTTDDTPRLIGKFRQIGAFTDDIAPAVNEGEWIYYIDRDGKMVFDLKEIDGEPVAEAGNFHCGLAAVRVGSKWGFINKQGKAVIKPQFAEVEPFSEGLALAAYEQSTVIKRWTVIDKNGNRLFDMPEGTEPLFHNGKTAGYKDGYIVMKDKKNNICYVVNRKGEYKKFKNSDITMPVYNGQIVYTNLKKGVTNMTYGDDEVYSFDNLIGNGKMLITRKDNERNYLVDKEGKTERLPIKGKIELLPENVKHSNDIVLVESDDDEVMKLRRINGESILCSIEIGDIMDLQNKTVKSEYIDIDRVVTDLALNGNGMLGFSMDNNITDILNRIGYTSREVQDYISEYDTDYTYLQYFKCFPTGSYGACIDFSSPYIIEKDGKYQFDNVRPLLISASIATEFYYGEDDPGVNPKIFEALKRKAQQFGTIDGYSYNDDVMNSITYVTKDRRYAYNISWSPETNGVEIAFGYIDYVPHGQGLSIKARKPTQSEEDYNYDEFSNNDY